MKKLIALFTLFILMLILQLSVYAYTEDIRITLDGKEVQFPDQRPYTDINGRTLVPVRFISQALGGTVIWEENGQLNTVTIHKGDKIITLKVGEKKATVNGVAKQLDTQAVEKNGRVLVPARFVSECLGAYVSWYGPTQTVIISTDMTAPTKIFTGGKVILINIKLEDNPLYIQLSKINGFTGANSLSATNKEFLFGDFNPYNNNIGDLSMSLDFSLEDTPAIINIDVEVYNEKNMDRLKKVLELMFPKYKDKVYETALNYMGGKRSDSYNKDIDSKYALQIKPLTSYTYPKDMYGCYITIFLK